MRDFARSMREIENLRGYSKEQIDALKEGILNMASNPRDTQFQGFANVLWDEICESFGDWWECDNDNIHNDAKRIIARRAYDFVCHVSYHVGANDLDFQGITQYVPDMTELPKETL